MGKLYRKQNIATMKTIFLFIL